MIMHADLLLGLAIGDAYNVGCVVETLHATSLQRPESGLFLKNEPGHKNPL